MCKAECQYMPSAGTHRLYWLQSAMLIPVQDLPCATHQKHIHKKTCCCHASKLKSKRLGKTVQAQHIDAWNLLHQDDYI